MPQWACGGQKTTWGKQFSPSMGAPEIGLSLLGLALRAFTHQGILLSLYKEHLRQSNKIGKRSHKNRADSKYTMKT